jgi:hypothetical protein
MKLMNQKTLGKNNAKTSRSKHHRSAKVKEELVNANNNNKMISKQQCDMFDRVCYVWLKSKGGEKMKKQMLKQTRVTYKANLYQKLKDEYNKQ